MKKIFGIMCMVFFISCVTSTGSIINLDNPNDPFFDEQWFLHNTGQTGGIEDADIDAIEAWDIETGNSDIIIAVIDSGIDYTLSRVG